MIIGELEKKDTLHYVKAWRSCSLTDVIYDYIDTKTAMLGVTFSLGLGIHLPQNITTIP